MQKVTLKLPQMEDYFTNESFKALRTNIQFCGTDVKLITFTSCDSNEGKTTISVGLAAAMADSGKRVLVIDTDMRKSVLLSKYVEESGLPGLSQYLSGMAKLEEVIFTVDGKGFDVIFAGKFPPNPVELLGGSRFKELLESKKSNYDYILIDSSPLGLVIDSAVVASNCDSAVIVVSAGKNKWRFVNSVKAQLEKSGCRILGVILNHTERRSDSYYRKHYGRYQGYGYYSKYGDIPDAGKPSK